uniref:Mitochondrial gtpase n=1 Tax=Colletotrichum fructicola (strain Nara gc5) TaxID=1213859 RepID=L2FIS6_COLFN
MRRPVSAGPSIHSRFFTSQPDFGLRDETVDDTVYALSTAQGRAGIAVYKGLCPKRPLPKPRYAAVRTLVDSQAGDDASILDSNALVLYFPGPNTVTGEDVLEFHVHGGSATVKAVLAAIPKCKSDGRIRYAEPGEFTKRAFLNDRLDLAQLLLARGELEALIDFAEDQHFDESPADLMSNVNALMTDMRQSILRHEAASQRSELSLMNLIVGREASIVSKEAGTTRDIVEVSLDIRGYLCSFADTAGIRAKTSHSVAADPNEPALGKIEEEGIRRAKQKAAESDIIIVLAAVEPSREGGFRINYDAETLKLASDAQACLVVVNKRDAVDSSTFAILVTQFRSEIDAHVPELSKVELITISCREAQSQHTTQKDPGAINGLTDQLVQSFANMTSLPSDQQDLLGVTARQTQLLEQCRGLLNEFMAVALPEHEGEEPDIVLAAEYLRYAADCLARITGRIEAGDVEEVLGVVFEK